MERQNADPLVQQVRQDISDGLYDGVEGDLEDYSAVQWQTPSDLGPEEVMGDIEKFNQAMAANSHMVVEGEGEWI